MGGQGSRPARLSRRRAISILGVGSGLGLVTALRKEAGLAALKEVAATGATKLDFPKGAIIRTILEDVSPEALGKGATLFHEHLSLEVPHPYVQWCSGQRVPPYCRPKESQPAHFSEDVELMVDEVRAAGKDGVSCIVDAGARDLGRNVEHLRTIAARSGVYIVASGGFHSQPMYPTGVERQTEDELSEELARDARAERWGALGEIGSSLEMQPDERKVFRAVSKVHLRTGLPIFTHTPHEGCPQCAWDQLNLLESQGVDPRRVCIGHLSDIRDDPKAETHKAIAKRGPFLGFDTVSHLPRLSPNVGMILAVLEAGYEDHVLLSHDGLSENLLKRSGGPGYSMLLTVFVPKLREAGVKEATLNKILVDNPRRFLAFVPKTSS
jgi:phosphotriesterase-related protein